GEGEDDLPAQRPQHVIDVVGGAEETRLAQEQRGWGGPRVPLQEPAARGCVAREAWYPGDEGCRESEGRPDRKVEAHETAAEEPSPGETRPHRRQGDDESAENEEDEHGLGAR